MPRKKTKPSGEPQRYIIEPLKEWYKTISERVTTLWDYMNCPYKTKYSPTPKATKNVFRIWHSINSVIQTYLWTWSDITFIYPEEYERRWYQKCISIAQSEIKEKYWYMMNEHNLSAEIEIGDYLLCIQGTPDLIMTDWDRPFIMDLKSSSSERDENRLNQQRQKYLYPFLWNINHPWYTIDRFDYFLFTTHSEPRHFHYSYIIDNDELAKRVDMILRNYVKNIQWQPEARKWPSCLWCPIKDICPAYMENIENTF